MVVRLEEEGGGRDDPKSSRLPPSLGPTIDTFLPGTMEFSLQEELAGLANADYDFPNELDVANMEPSEVNATLNGPSPSCPTESTTHDSASTGIVDTITGGSHAIQEPEVFDTFRSMLK